MSFGVELVNMRNLLILKVVFVIESTSILSVENKKKNKDSLLEKSFGNIEITILENSKHSYSESEVFYSLVHLLSKFYQFSEHNK